MTIKINGDNTVANPGFSGDDTDTGLQVGTNELKLVTGGSEAVTVDSSQNLGIGTNSPNEKLHIAANNSAIGSNWTNARNLIRIEDTDTTQANGQITGGIVFEGNDSDASGVQAGIFVQLASATGGGDIAFHTAASGTTLDGTESPRMSIDDSGRVSINSGYVTLNGNQIGGIQVSIADDAFATITPPRIGGHFIFVNTVGDGAFPRNNATGFACVDFGNSPNIKLTTVGTEMEVNSSGPPTGTTGSDVHVTLFAGGTSGKVYLENRLGGSYTFQVTFI